MLKKTGTWLQESNFPFEDKLIQIIISSRYSFLTSYTPISFSNAIEIVFPKLGLVVFSIHANYNWNFYYQFHKLNVSLNNSLFEPLQKGKEIDEALFSFVLKGIQSPVLIYSFIKNSTHLSLKQKEALYSRVNEVFKELTKDNRILFCKQIVYLLVSDLADKKTFQETVNLINTISPDLFCSIQQYEQAHLVSRESLKGLELEDILLDNNSLIFSNGTHYLPIEPVSVQRDSFYKYDHFITDDKSQIILLAPKLSASKTKVHLKKAHLIYSTLVSDRFSNFIYHLECLHSLSVESDPQNIILGSSIDLHLINFLSKMNMHSYHFLSESNCSVEKLFLLEDKKNSSFLLSPDLKEFILNHLSFDKTKYKDKTIILTNTFKSLDEDQRLFFKNVLSKNEGFYVDIEITPYLEIINIFLNARIIIAGQHPIMNLDILRENIDTTLILADTKSLPANNRTTNIYTDIRELGKVLESVLNPLEMI